MLRTQKVRPSLEALEDRCTPSATVAVSGGNLLVTGTATRLGIQASDTGLYMINADGVIQVVSGVNNDIRVNLTNNTGSAVTIDLGNGVAAHALQNLTVNTGGGADTVTVRNGMLNNGISINTGAGNDKIYLGDNTVTTTTQLNVAGSVEVDAGGDTGDVLTIRKGTTVNGSLYSDSGNTLVLEQGAVVKRDMNIAGGAGGNSVTIAGSVGNDLWFFGSSRAGASDTLTLTKTGSVGHDLVAYTDGLPTSTLPPYLLAYYGLNAFTGNPDTVTLDGTIGNNAVVDTGAGSDTVTFGPDLTIAGSAAIYLGGGDDTFNYNTPKTHAITAYIDSGPGNDTLNGAHNMPNTVTPVRFKTVNP